MGAGKRFSAWGGTIGFYSYKGHSGGQLREGTGGEKQAGEGEGLRILYVTLPTPIPSDLSEQHP